MIIAHISDTHISTLEPHASARLDQLEQAVSEINRLNPAADVVIHTGDVVHDDRKEEYRQAHRLLQRLNAPYFVIPGNRDRRATMIEVFGDACGGTDRNGFIQYALERWSTRLIMLDTLNENDRLGVFCQQRQENLVAMLKKDTRRPAIVFMHHPPFDVVDAPEPFQFDSRETVARFADIVGKFPQVKAVYCGHSHRRAHDRIGDVPVTTIPALAIDLRRGAIPASLHNRPIFDVLDC